MDSRVLQPIQALKAPLLQDRERFDDAVSPLAASAPHSPPPKELNDMVAVHRPVAGEVRSDLVLVPLLHKQSSVVSAKTTVAVPVHRAGAS
jgi:hypothetical protein